MSTVKAKDNLDIEINGVRITKGNTYLITPKPDEDAPNGFRQRRTTKVISPRITNTVGCIKSPITNTWDTGFYEFSPCYRNMNDKEKTDRIEVVNKFIKDPLDRLYGNDGRLNQNNDEFWDDYGVTIGNGMIFNTNDPKQLLDLYMIVLHNHVAAEENPSYEALKKAQFSIINKESAISRREKKTFNKTEAIGTFHTLIKNNKSKLLDILGYIGLSIDESSSDMLITNVVVESYFEHKEDSDQNIEIFLETVDLANTEEGRKELNFYKELKNLYKKGRIQKEGSEYTLDGEVLGSSFRVAAKKVAKSQELEEKLIELLD